MRKLGILLAIGLLAGFSPAQAETVDMPKPLLIVRFNQPNIYFERALKQAVSSAEKAKPGVMYEVVSYVPERSADANAKNAASFNLNTITGFMQQLGVPVSRLKARMQISSAVSSQEVQIFVK